MNHNYKIVSIDKRKVEGMPNTIKYVCVVYAGNKHIDYFDLLESDGTFWAWTADTISGETISRREDIAERLNNKELALSGTI